MPSICRARSNRRTGTSRVRNFIALHELFDKISDVVLEHIDEIAERVTSLGGTAEGTVAVAAKRSKLKNYP